MQLLPAIDLKSGKAVRLYKGDFAKVSVVHEDPLAQAEVFGQAKMSYLHVVDLDGALEGKAVNATLIAQIKKQAQMRVEVGGGIRTLAQIQAYLAAGIDRVIIGSMAVKSPTFVKEALATFGPEKVVVGIDAKDGLVATEGWVEVSQVTYLELAKKMVATGVQTIIYTDVDKDGTLTGPNFDHYRQLLRAVPNCQIIASGGVHAVEDLHELQQIGVAGVIVGKAFYEGKISLEEMQQFEDERRP